MIYDRITALTAAERKVTPGQQHDITISVQKVLDETESAWGAVLQTKIKGAVLLTGKNSNAGVVDLGVNIDLELFNKAAAEVARLRTAKIQMEIAKNTLKRVSQHIAMGIEQGQSIIDTAKSIRDLFDDMSQSRSQLIAQVETGIAAGKGDYMNAEATGLDLVKLWSSAEDEKVRDSHRIDGEVVDFDELFSNGMLYPMWEQGPIEEIANCRCCLLSVPKGEEDQWT